MRIDRHSVMYQCDHCPRREVVFDEQHSPLDDEEWPLTPKGWFSVLDRRGERTKSVDLCSAACLQAWAGKQGGEGG